MEQREAHVPDATQPSSMNRRLFLRASTAATVATTLLPDHSEPALHAAKPVRENGIPRLSDFEPGIDISEKSIVIGNGKESVRIRFGKKASALLISTHEYDYRLTQLVCPDCCIQITSQNNPSMHFKKTEEGLKASGQFSVPVPIPYTKKIVHAPAIWYGSCISDWQLQEIARVLRNCEAERDKRKDRCDISVSFDGCTMKLRGTRRAAFEKAMMARKEK